MDENLYYYETIEECEKAIIDKAIDVDIIYSANANLFECFIRTIRTAALWIELIVLIIVFIKKGIKFGLIIFIIFIALFGLYHLLMSWVKFNYHRSFINAKSDLVTSMVFKCKEFNETNYAEWQVSQMLKRFSSLATLTRRNEK